ncbi:MAG TPA: EAL domain-containing protein [Burkholderiales bacterium]
MVEDVEADALLAARELKRAGLAVDSRRVEREGDFRRELGEFRPDVILSDFNMPHFDGMSALAIARETVPDVPFIFLSGTLGEDYAIRALKNGATDYVLKNNLVRLPPAVERAVSEAKARVERRRGEQLLALEHTVVRHIADADNASAGLKAVIRAVCETEGWDLGRYFGMDEKAGLLRFEEHWCIPERPLQDFIESSRDVTFTPGAGLVGVAWQSEEPLWSTDTTTDRRVRQADLSHKFAIHGAFVIPIVSEGKKIGVLAFSSRQNREPDERLLRAMQVIGTQIGQFLARQEQQRHIARLNRIYAVLSGINSTIVRVQDRDELFREACRIAVRAGGFRLAWIGAVDRQANRLEPVAWEGAGGDYIELMPLGLTEDGRERFGLAGLAIEQRKAMIADDMTKDPRVHLGKEALARGFRSLAMLPLFVSNEPVGLLALYAEAPGFFNQEDEMRLLLELAGDIGFALDHIEKADRLNYLAYYDPLTGLANATLFRERLARYVDAAREAGHKLALVLTDVDRFKTINDTLGRPAGDELLKQIARRSARDSHNPGEIARIAADRFASVLPRVNVEENTGRLIELRHNECFGTPFEVNGSELRVAAKAGIAMFPEDGADADTLFKNAEAALKKAKETNEPYLFYTQKLTEKVAERLSLENKLRQALEKEEFILHYQPKVETETRRIVGVEALIRWMSPERGLVPPLEFIPLLEETGLIIEVGTWALGQAVRDHEHWVEQGLRTLRVAVNVSAIQLRKANFIAVVEEAIGRGATPHGLDLEITESLLMEEITANVEKMKALRELGVGVAIDDFGTGYSSLGYLTKLPVQSLKIDRSFIITMLTEPGTMTLVQTIISLASSLRLKVVAEGVDSEDQANCLRLSRCDEMQGYLISKPVPRDNITVLLREKETKVSEAR